MTEPGYLWDALEALSDRLEVLEGGAESTDQLAGEAERAQHLGNLVEQAYHLIIRLEPRVEALETTFAAIEGRLADIDTMAAETWDRVAIARRLAAIEDRLMITESPGGHEGA